MVNIGRSYSITYYFGVPGKQAMYPILITKIISACYFYDGNPYDKAYYMWSTLDC